MATIKVKFRPSADRAAAGTIVYQVIQLRNVRRINSGFKIFPSEWDGQESRICMAGADASRKEYLRTVKQSVDRDMSRLMGIVASLEKAGGWYSSDSVVALYHRHALSNVGIISYASSLIDTMRSLGKVSTAETYANTLSSFSRFRLNEDILIEDINSTLLVAYEQWMIEEGLCPNTTSFYMRNLRAIYNRAVDEGLVLQSNPFKHVYTGVDKTVKRAVTVDIIRDIRNLDLSGNPGCDYARDIFMFSFYTRGMSFVDMAFLKKSDLRGGVLTYRRQKTNQKMTIKWEKQMQSIVDKYDTSGSPYLLPIIRDIEDDSRRQYRNASHLTNVKLKQIGRKLGLISPLTTYVARHSWASAAKSMNVSVSTISEAMGHNSEMTTRIYLATLDTSRVDSANEMVLGAL